MLFGLSILQGFFLFGHLTGGNSFPKPLSAEEEQKYLREYAAGSEDARNILIERNLRLVAHVTKKYSQHAKDNEDLISIGTIGLIKAVASFKSDKNVRLATYAARCIENAIVLQRLLLKILTVKLETMYLLRDDGVCLAAWTASYLQWCAIQTVG